jgi:UDP-N-acetylmuramoylalanine--D-glutamate ligase
MNLFLERCPARLVGITGSAGKSTTTAMTAAILERAAESSHRRFGRVFVGGNIGRSLLDDLATMQKEDVVVLELSSFQLEDAGRIRRSPHFALVTNIRENHLDRHGSLAEYAAAKSNIYQHQNASDCLLLPDDAGAENLPHVDSCVSRVMRFGVDAGARCALLPGIGKEGRDSVRLNLTLPGAHNLANAAGALAIARQLGVDDETAVIALNAFAGLPHRLEFVREFGGARYYNDSKATSPEAAMTSMRAFDAPLIVLLGGSNKGSCYLSLGALVASRAKAAVCFGETGPAICNAIEAFGDAGGMETACVATLDDALVIAKANARPGDVVLLSPACASYDQYANYEQRGAAFCATVRSWAASSPTR